MPTCEGVISTHLHSRTVVVHLLAHFSLFGNFFKLVVENGHVLDWFQSGNYSSVRKFTEKRIRKRRINNDSCLVGYGRFYNTISFSSTVCMDLMLYNERSAKRWKQLVTICSTYSSPALNLTDLMAMVTGSSVQDCLLRFCLRSPSPPRAVSVVSCFLAEGAALCF